MERYKNLRMRMRLTAKHIQNNTIMTLRFSEVLKNTIKGVNTNNGINSGWKY